VVHYSLHEDGEEIVLAEVKGLCRTLERTSRSLPAAGKELLPTLAGGMDVPLEIEQRCTAGVKGSGCVQRQARAGQG
jgi:hypothetical protein